MANILTGRRILYILLGLLLISGAVLAAVAMYGAILDGANPAASQPSDQVVEDNVVVPVTGAGVEEKSVGDPYYQSGSGCSHEVAENPLDW